MRLPLALWSCPRPIGCVLLLIATLAAPAARAQYMYLDSNGDGIHSAADVLPTSGTATVDVWLTTNQNRDGSVVTCGPYPLTMSSYEFCLRAVDGRVAFSGFVNHADMPIGLFAGGTATEFYAAQFGISQVPAGLHRLASVSVAVTMGAPSLQIVPDAPTLDHVAPSPPETAFGSPCQGVNYNNTITLGVDWFDVDGLPSGAPLPNGAPALAALADMTVGVGDISWQELRATDPDGDPVTFALETGPSFLDVTTQDAGRGAAAGALYAVPHRSDLGMHTATVSASDGAHLGHGSIQVRVTEAVNHAPILSLPSRIAMVAGSRWEKTFVARDFDGQPLAVQKTAGPDFLSASVFGQGAGGAVGSVRAGPSLCDAGEYDGVISVSDGLSTIALPIHLSVRPAMPAPPADLIELSTRRYPAGIAGGDLNGDGLMDLVVANDLQVLSVFVSQGGGAFAPELTYAIAPQPGNLSSVVLADYNEDGHLDAAIGVRALDYIAVIFGRGDGTFGSGYTIPAQPAPEALLAIDLNDDGNQDLVVANSGAPTISVLLGDGTGSFAPRRDIRVPGAPYGLAAGDWNRDGRLDLAVAGSFFSTVSILLGHGDGTFREATPLAAGKAPFSIATGDWNRDGALDLAVADYDGVLFIYRGDGAGGFVKTDEFTGFSSAGLNSLQSVTAGDLTGDGIDDLVAASVLGFNAQVFRGDGAGGFTRAETITLPRGAYQCAIGDVDGDAVPDLAITDEEYGSVFVRRYPPAAEATGFARAFVTGDHRPVIAASRTPAFCVRLEPVENSFRIEDVDEESLRLVSEGTGSVESIPAETAKGSIAGDRDHNDVIDLSVCFSGANLAALFDQVVGRANVDASLQGRLRNGRFFCTRLVLDVQGSTRPLQAAVVPNPLNPNGVLRFATSRPGPLSVTLFDIQGRRVRTLVAGRNVPAGMQRIEIDGRTDTGSMLASGIYFYRIEAADGSVKGRFSILK